MRRGNTCAVSYGAYDEAVDVWVCAGRLNVAGTLAFSEEQRLRLAVAMIEVVRDSSSHTPVVISFDQPWAEYLATDDYDLSPLHFADALVRAELGVGGIALEMNLGYWPGGCLPRDLLAISRHLDRWSLLGIPLIVYLTMPSSADDDPQRRRQLTGSPSQRRRSVHPGDGSGPGKSPRPTAGEQARPARPRVEPAE